MFEQGSFGRIALNKYAEWLNLWFKDDNKRTPGLNTPMLKFDDFFKYGETKQLSNGKALYYDFYTFQAGYGDDGGPALLLAIFDDGGNLDTLIQEFDTNWSIIWTNGSFLATPALTYGKERARYG